MLRLNFACRFYRPFPSLLPSQTRGHCNRLLIRSGNQQRQGYAKYLSIFKKIMTLFGFHIVNSVSNSDRKKSFFRFQSSLL